MKKETMSWERCEAEFIEKVECDTDKIAAILKMSKVRLRFFQKQEADEETSFKKPSFTNWIRTF